MAITQLKLELVLELLKFFANLAILIVSLLECSLVELFLFANEEDLILFPCENLGQGHYPILSLS